MNEQIFSVSQITAKIKRLFAENFEPVWIEGELSGLKWATSGHLYFTLKDSAAQMSCAMWKGSASRLNFKPADGLKIQAWGTLEVYEPQGKYQLIVSQLRPAGLGELQQAFEALKAKLQAEGLFELSRKRPLPKFPEKLGIVTSATGAVIHDMSTVAGRRWPAAQFDLRAVRVQGAGAAEEIAAAVRKLSSEGIVDLIVVARGGGSLEDLWPFNEEIVARAIFESKIPVVSAVGHEVDVTIADWVADLRAPTPSAAMEIILPDYRDILREVQQLSRRLRSNVVEPMRSQKQILDALSSHWALREPLNTVRMAAQRLDDISSRASNAVLQILDDGKSELSRLSELLIAYSPQAVLERGYAIVQTADEKVIRRAGDTKSGDSIKITLSKGSVTAEVLSTDTQGT